MNNENNKATETNITNGSTASGNIPAVAESEKPHFSDISVKELLAKSDVQDVLRRHVAVPKEATFKKLKKAFENKETKITTQKIQAVSGTTLANAMPLELTLVNMELDPVKSVNKRYRIIDYTLALEANMTAGKFGGYAATGLKLMVTKLEEVRGDGK